MRITILLGLCVAINSLAAETPKSLYQKTASSQMHKALVQGYLAHNPEGMADKIHQSYNFACTLNERLKRESSEDIARLNIPSIQSSLDPFDPGVSLAALPNSSEQKRISPENKFACAEAPRRTFVELSQDMVPVYFNHPDFDRYFYVANFSHYDLKNAAAFLGKTESAGKERLRLLDQSASEQFYVARIPKLVTDVVSQDVQMLWLKIPVLLKKPVSHLQVRFFFNEPIVIVPQRLTTSGPIGKPSELSSLVFTTEANGLPGFTYDATKEAKKDIAIKNLDWQKGTFLNFYRFKSLETSVRDSYPARTEASRKGFPLVQYKLTGLSQAQRSEFFTKILQLGSKNGSHQPYFLLANNCAVGIFSALDDTLNTPEAIRQKVTPLSRRLLISIPWETHHAYQLRKVLDQEPDREKISTLALESTLLKSIPSEGVREYCTAYPGDPFGVCKSFGY